MIQDETLDHLGAVCASGRFSFYKAGDLENQGYVRALEDIAKEYFNIKHAIALNSATAGLHIASKIIGKFWEESIFVPAVTFSATASSVYMAQKIPLIVDIEPDTYCIDFSKTVAARDHDAAVIAVHLHGHPADLDKAPNIPVIEDCSQAIGAEYKGKKVGTIGDIGVFSFNQNKQITCGEGGLLITDDDELAYKARLMSNHGEVCSDILGYNYRMAELQAAVLIPQFQRLDEIVNEKRELAHRLTDKLKDIEGLTPPMERDCKHSYCTYPVRVAENISRDELQQGLLKEGVYFGKGGYKPLHLFEFYQGKEGDFPVAEECYKTVMYTNDFKDANKIVEAIKKCLKKHI